MLRLKLKKKDNSARPPNANEPPNWPDLVAMDGVAIDALPAPAN